MSIATEITRLQTAKTNIFSSLEEKGVTVPANTTYSGVSALIDSIPEPVADVIAGSMTYTSEMISNKRVYTITLTFSDAIKGKGGRVVLFDTHLGEEDMYGKIYSYPYYIYFGTDGSVTSFDSTYMGIRPVTVNSVTWNATGDTVTLKCDYNNLDYLDYTPTAIWFAETF